jgi:hypothetical protein
MSDKQVPVYELLARTLARAAWEVSLPAVLSAADASAVCDMLMSPPDEYPDFQAALRRELAVAHCLAFPAECGAEES